MKQPRYALGTAALMIGSAVNYFGDRLLGVRLELFHDLMTTFGLLSLTDIFVVPFISGLTVSWVFGHGGKWLCYFPPFFVRCIAYADLSLGHAVPPGYSLLPMGWWGFFVVLVIEAAAFGGILGEIFIKRVYSRSAAARAADVVRVDRTPDAGARTPDPQP